MSATHGRDTQHTIDEEDLESGGVDREILEAIEKHYAASRNQELPPETSVLEDKADPIQAKATQASSRNEYAVPKVPRQEAQSNKAYSTPMSSSSTVTEISNSIPGAYAEAPPVDMANDSRYSSSSNQAESGTLDLNLVSATEVEHQEQLQQAQPFVATNGPTCKRGIRSRKACGLFIAFLGAVVLVTTVLAVRFAGPCNDTPSPTPASPVTPTASPSSLLQAELLQMFPDYTLQELSDHKTAQARAFAWILEDPNLSLYIEEEWRVKQRFALASLYYSTGGSNWTHNDGFLSYEIHECQWFTRSQFSFPRIVQQFPTYQPSLPCGSADGQIFQHVCTWLYSNGLAGSLPEELYLLDSLKSVSLFDNSLTGTISSRIGQLKQLEGWSVSQNLMSGSLPSELGQLSSTLFFWNCFHAQLAGTLPSEMGQLSLLETLVMDFNQFSGSIPPQIGGLTNLVLWYGNHNQLTGQLPTEMGQLESLVDVHLDYNSLTGLLPTQIGQLSSMKDIGFVSNSMTGALPTELGLLVTQLEVLELQENGFSGTLPSELSGLPYLTHLLLQGNRLTGRIPPEMQQLWMGHGNASSTSMLRAFNLTGNPITKIDESDLMCWTHSTFYDSQECMTHYPVALSCWCHCSC